MARAPLPSRKGPVGGRLVLGTLKLERRGQQADVSPLLQAPAPASSLPSRISSPLLGSIGPKWKSSYRSSRCYNGSCPSSCWVSWAFEGEGRQGPPPHVGESRSSALQGQGKSILLLIPSGSQMQCSTPGMRMREDSVRVSGRWWCGSHFTDGKSRSQRR